MDVSNMDIRSFEIFVWSYFFIASRHKIKEDG